MVVLRENPQDLLLSYLQMPVTQHSGVDHTFIHFAQMGDMCNAVMGRGVSMPGVRQWAGAQAD